MRRLLVIVDMILAVLIYGGFRALPRVSYYGDPTMRAYADNIGLVLSCLVLSFIVLNVAWLVIAGRRHIASGAIGGAALGVRASRWAGAKASAVKQQVIDRANQP